MKRFSTILYAAKHAQLKPHPAFTLLATIGLYLIAGVVMAIPLIITKIAELNGEETEIGSYSGWIDNVLLLGVIAVFVVYCVYFEKRTPRSMGFTRKNILPQYLQGAFLGWLMLSLALGLCLLTGTMEFRGLLMSASIGIIALWLLGFIIQGMSEEVVCRGFLMVSLSNRIPLAWAIFTSSVLFSCLHLLNNEISWLAILNLFLYGVFASLYFLRTDNIWAVSAHHSLWNWSQGNLYGIEVSGLKIEETVWEFAATGKGTIISGGQFGLEGGLAATLILGLAIGYLLMPRKRAA